jgi:hypothetical protein
VADLRGDLVSRYALRISARNVRGTVQLPVETLTAAKSLANEWKKTLTAEWKIEIVDNEGVTQWTL